MALTNKSKRNKRSKLESKSDSNVKMTSNSKKNKSATLQPNLDIQPFGTSNGLYFNLRYLNYVL